MRLECSGETSTLLDNALAGEGMVYHSPRDDEDES
jgi:hypothetical protein